MWSVSWVILVSIAVYPVCAANKTALHYDKDMFSVNRLHMEDTQSHWDLCQAECKTSDECTL